MEDKNSNPPAKLIGDIRCFRFASIMFNVCVFCFVLSIMASVSSFIIPLFYAFVMLFAIFAFLALLFLVVITFGLILLVPDNPLKLLLNFISNSNMDKVMLISQKLFDIVPYACIIGMSLATASIIASAFSKQNGKVGKIISSSIFIVLMTLMLIIYYKLGGMIWQN